MEGQSHFEEILGGNEQTIWLGKPSAAAFYSIGVPVLAAALVWGSIDYLFYRLSAPSTPGQGGVPIVTLFLTIHSLPCWLAVFYVIWLFAVFGNTFYAFTDRRVLLRSGVFGTDFTSIDYDQIEEMDVTVNPLEKVLGVGTIRIYSGKTGSRGARAYDNLIGIRQPYDVYKHLKDVSLNVKTDWSYPNALRPEENPGYKTKLKETE